jgi:RNA polymerase sigma-70 factor (sigma-E family)
VPEAAEFAEFVASSHRALLRSAYLLVGDRGQAEDVVQDALFRTYLSWDRLRAADAAYAYTRTTLVRLVGRGARRRWRGELPSGRPGNERDAAAVPDADLALDVRHALAELPWGQRAALVLRYFDDLSEAETAAVLGCSVGTVKSRTNRGLQALRGRGLLAEPAESEVTDA